MYIRNCLQIKIITCGNLMRIINRLPTTTMTVLCLSCYIIRDSLASPSVAQPASRDFIALFILYVTPGSISGIISLHSSGSEQVCTSESSREHQPHCLCYRHSFIRACMYVHSQEPAHTYTYKLSRFFIVDFHFMFCAWHII